jgi:hypothetical protein
MTRSGSYGGTLNKSIDVAQFPPNFAELLIHKEM